MAVANIKEFVGLPTNGSGQVVPVVSSQDQTNNNVTFTTTTQSAAFQPNTRFIRVVCPVACHLEFGENPTATTASLYLPADTVEYFGVKPGEKVALVET